jgi:hypothetical protein
MGKKAFTLYCPFNVSNGAYLSDELLKKSTVGEGLIEVSVTRRIPSLHILFGPAHKAMVLKCSILLLRLRKNHLSQCSMWIRIQLGLWIRIQE